MTNSPAEEGHFRQQGRNQVAIAPKPILALVSSLNEVLLQDPVDTFTCHTYVSDITIPVYKTSA